MKLKTAVIYGSNRSARQGIKAARYIIKTAEKRGHEVSFVDTMEYQLPLLDKMYKEFEAGAAPEPMEQVAEIFRNADGFLWITGEYNHSIPGPLKNLMDHFQKEYLYKPSGIVSYSAGRFAGMRAAVHMRAILAELGTPAIPTINGFGMVQKIFNENGEPQEDYIEGATEKFFEEYEWYAGALKSKRSE